MYSAHFFEMLTPLAHAERLAQAEHERFTRTAVEGTGGNHPLCDASAGQFQRQLKRVRRRVSGCATRTPHQITPRVVAQGE
jgi:hypothetical protein